MPYKKNIIIKIIYTMTTMKNIYVNGFPRALPLRLGESTFTVPPAHP